jgi:hypothetical protein
MNKKIKEYLDNVRDFILENEKDFLKEFTVLANEDYELLDIYFNSEEISFSYLTGKGYNEKLIYHLVTWDQYKAWKRRLEK